ncbi:MAG: hypothetical protein ABWY12_11800, partial [Burkholderiales bacterium]
ILFYGRGGFDVIDPRHFPYRQPDFRDPAAIAETGNRPIPFMLLLRRMGRERQARLPIDEASAVMRLLYDDFSCFSDRDHLNEGLEIVLDRLAKRREKGKNDVALLPLPTGGRNLQRLRRLFRYDVYQRYYPDAPGTERYRDEMRERLRSNPNWLEGELVRLATELEMNPRYVYGSRDRRFLVDAMPALLAEAEDVVPSTEGPPELAPAPATGASPSSAS